ncbi:hypothetical protein ZWY2020_008323 [Hordeum vulgare]|nr:hypothetical protein ZWY2020_008323 [Hordeum vulgare]
MEMETEPPPAPDPCAPVAALPVAAPAVVAAAVSRAGAPVQGPPRHVLPLPHRRPQGAGPAEQGRLVEAAAAAVPRHRPRVAPLLCDSIREHGKVSLSWFGPIPKVTIADPELARSVLSDKSGHFEKPKFPALWRLLANGLLNHEGDKWVKHRRLLNPAFHLEKIKCMLPEFSACCEELVRRWTESIGSDGTRELDIWPELKNLSLPTPNNRRMYQVNNEIESIIRSLIVKRTKAIKEGERTKDDLLSLLLKSNMMHIDNNGQSDMGMTIEDVIEECKTFFLAGMETTSVLLTWTMIVLSMHPEWQNRAREEVLDLFGKSKPGYEGLNRLKTVTMILYEVLRLYPPSIHFSRKTCKEVMIGDKTYPAGMMIELSVLLMHHDPDIWGSDVHEFKPERFAEGISKASNNSGAFLPFGWGPRICIGHNFALIEAKMAICMILQSFDFMLASSYTHAPYTMVTLHPMHGAQIRLGLI